MQEGVAVRAVSGRAIRSSSESRWRLFVGATGKSAQIPLYVWLPDAMEGPTPVSALIHAATMVTAGVYMVARSNWIFQLAPEAMVVVAVVGALTALFAASIGLVQNDIKRVLAYSTVSQLGYMFLALGVGRFRRRHLPPDDARVLQGAAVPRFRQRDSRDAPRAGHAQDGRAEEQDSDHVLDDGHRNARHCGDSAVCAGFFSKDEILWQAFSSEHGHPCSVADRRRSLPA